MPDPSRAIYASTGRASPGRPVELPTIFAAVIAAPLGVDSAGGVITWQPTIIPGVGELLGIGELREDA